MLAHDAANNVEGYRSRNQTDGAGTEPDSARPQYQNQVHLCNSTGSIRVLVPIILAR